MKVIGEDIVAPNCTHHLFLTKFAVNFSEAKIWGPADLFDKRQDIQFIDALDDKIEAWSPQNIIVAYGEVIIENAAQLLKEPLSKLRAI